MASQWTKNQELLVWGYIRETENIYYIPIEINNIIYLYQKICDKWNKNLSNNKYIKMNKSQSMIIIENDIYNTTVFGENIVSKGIFKWKIQILSLIYNGFSKMEGPFIGIIENKEKNLIKYKNNDEWHECGYQLCAGNGDFVSYLKYNKFEWNNNCKWNKNNDILEIILNLNKQTLSFKVYDKRLFITSYCKYYNIKQTDYRLAVSIEYFQGSKFQLL